MDRLRHNCFTGFTAKAVSPSQRFIQRIVSVVFLFSFFSVGLREVPAQKIRNTPDQQIADAANAELELDELINELNDMKVALVEKSCEEMSAKMPFRACGTEILHEYQITLTRSRSSYDAAI